MNNTFSWKTIGQSLIAALMAASSSQVILAAAGLGGGSVGVWCAALAVAALWAMSGVHHRLRLAGKLAALAAAVAIVCAQAGRIGDVRAWAAAAMNGEAAEASVIRGACLALSAVLPAVFCLIYGWFLNSFSDAVLPLTVFLPVLVFSYAATPGLSVWPAVPGLMAALTAFVSGGFPKWDRSFWLTAGASALVVLLAALFLPARAPVSGPLENAAGTVRRMFEDYFRFNEERVPFTISTEGYNHAVQAEGGVEARLGGPASPSEETVMEVRASQPLLLRGAVRRTYTGNAWVDPDAKARYLFFDVFRRSLRDRLFCMHDNGAFDRVPAEVRFLADGPSALFVPSRMDGLSMDLRTAVYFNSIGEIFLSRTVRAGDAYSLTARTAPEGDEAVRRAVLEAAGRDDRAYAANTGNCLQLPEGIDPEVYRLAASITDGAENDYDRAAAIASWLRSNIRYTLTPSYPDDSRDFVSQVLLGSREGYCSYYATAMAVLCRMSGLPARYVEGYSVKPEADGTALVTGRNAHAWCEVYFPNVGWIAFDPTGGSGDGAGNGGS
ncbi:MAG: transglutaminase domain-containing protein, partial [Clostridia bacterium]|nr:transglutaminase domain-containing protein [Clostridia bacterium]